MSKETPSAWTERGQLLVGGALAGLLALRLWHLPQQGLPDYDSVRNWQLVQALAHGDLRHLFHHASPGFLLSYAPVAWLTTDVRVFQTLNALLAVAGLAALVVWVARQARLPAWEAALLLLLAGTGLLLTFAGRDFTMNAGSLGLATGLLAAWHQRQRRPGEAGPLLAAAGWLAAGLCYNYKFLLVVPILATLELWRADGSAWRNGTWWRAGLILAAPYLVLGAVGVFGAGLPWYRWPAVYWRLVVPAAANEAGRHTTLHPDLLYYFRYLLAFESPLLLGGLALAGWLLLRHPAGRPRREQPLPLLALLLAWSGCWLAGMSLLIKAPWGMLLAYAPLAALAVLSLRQVLPARLRALLLVAALGLNGLRLWQHVYAFPATNYPAVAAWLRVHDVRRVASTVGLGLAPYLAPGTELVVITDERQLPALRRRGFHHVILDDYWRVTNIQRFSTLRQRLALARWPEPRLTSPLLFLEHAEFTGLSYDETLAVQRGAAADGAGLRVIEF